MARYDGKDGDRKCRCTDKRDEHCGEDGACMRFTESGGADHTTRDYCPCTKFDPTRQVKVRAAGEERTITVSGDRTVTIFQLGDKKRFPSSIQLQHFKSLVIKAYEDPDFVIVMPGNLGLKVTQVAI